MWVLLGLLKAILTDLSGGFHPRKFKDPADELPVWRIAQDINDFKDLLKMSQDELSEEQRQALLEDDEARKENTVLHSFPPSREELKAAQEASDEEAYPDLPPIPESSFGEIGPDSSSGDDLEIQEANLHFEGPEDEEAEHD